MVRRISSFVIYILLAITTLLVILLGGISFFWSNLNNYQRPIKAFIASNIGVKIDFQEVIGNLDFNFEPEVTIKNLQVTDIKTQIPIIKINTLFARLSLSSLLHLEPILAKLTIDGVNADIDYDKDDNIKFNKYIVTNLNDKESSNIDYEKILLLQKNIELKNINLKLIDSKHAIIPVELSNLKLSFKNNRIFHSHDLDLSFLFDKRINVHTILEERGERLFETKYWNNANFSLSTADESGHTVIAGAQVKDKKLQFFNLNFNTTTQAVKQINDQIRGNTELSGNLNVQIDKNDNYVISGKDLNINTVAGNILNNAKIIGKYELDNGGSIKLDQINLNGLSSIKWLNIYDKYKLQGMINNINYDFNGNIFTPEHFNLTANLNNFAIKAIDKSYPAINNLTSSIKITDTNAQIITKLTQSKISYPKYLANDITINNAQFNVNLRSETNQYLNIVDLESAYVNTRDFNLTLHSLVNVDKQHIKLNMQATQFNLVNAYKYLPLTIGESNIRVIKNNIISGNLKDLNVNIDSNFESLPQSGIVLTTNINNVGYKLDKKIAPVKNLNAKLALVNDNLAVHFTGADIGEYKVESATLNLKQLYAKVTTLDATVLTKGSTQALINLVKNSEYGEYLTDMPVFNITGYNNIKVNVNSKLNDLKHLKLSGQLKVIDNNINFTNNYPTVSKLDGVIHFNQNGLLASEINGNVFNSDFIFKIHNNNELGVLFNKFNYTNLYKYFASNYQESSAIITGQSDLEIQYNMTHKKVNVYSSLSGVGVNAPVPFAKTMFESKPLEIEYILNKDHVINLNYYNAINADIILDSKFEPLNAKIAIGDTSIPSNYPARFYLKANVSETKILDWTNFISQITSDFATKEQNPNNKNTSKPDFLKEEIFFDWTTKAVWLDNYNIDGGNVTGSFINNLFDVKFDFSDIYGQVDYYLNKNFVNINLNKLIINTKNIVGATTESSIINLVKVKQVKHSNKSQFVAKQNSRRKERTILSQKVESSFFNESEIYVDNRDVNAPKVNIPDIKLYIKNLYFQNHYLGSLTTNIVQRNNNLYVESASLINQVSTTIFRIIEYNVNPDGSKKHYTDLRLRTNINNLGKLFTKLDLGDDLTKGHGLFDLTLNWGGGIKDFNLYKNKGKISMHVKDGTFTQIKPGLFGSLFGVVSLTSITHAGQLNMNTFFGQGVTFEDWDTDIDLVYNRLDIKNLTLTSPSATIKSFGTLDIQNMNIDSYLTVEPRLGATVATTAGIVTLNPIIGLFVYAGQAIIGNPINKLLAISYHITGTVDEPKMTKVNLNDQIQHNFSSSANLVQGAQDTVEQIRN